MIFEFFPLLSFVYGFNFEAFLAVRQATHLRIFNIYLIGIGIRYCKLSRFQFVGEGKYVCENSNKTMAECSIAPGITSDGAGCANDGCANQGFDYKWCKAANKWNWGYCSKSEQDYGFLAADPYKSMCDSQGTKYF